MTAPFRILLRNRMSGKNVQSDIPWERQDGYLQEPVDLLVIFPHESRQIVTVHVPSSGMETV